MSISLSVEQKAEQYDILMALIREKIYQSNTTQEQLHLLTLAPQICSRETQSEFFGVSEHLIRESRTVFKKTGILGEIDCKKGIVILKIK